VARPSIVIALPTDEATPVAAELQAAGYTAISVRHPDELEALLASHRDIAIAILDGDTDFDRSLQFYDLVHEEGRSIPALMVMSSQALDRIESTSGASGLDDEFLARPYSADSIRWRVEAMCIRSQTEDDGSGPVLQTGLMGAEGWASRATVVAVFNPKGGSARRPWRPTSRRPSRSASPRTSS